MSYPERTLLQACCRARWGAEDWTEEDCLFALFEEAESGITREEAQALVDAAGLRLLPRRELRTPLGLRVRVLSGPLGNYVLEDTPEDAEAEVVLLPARQWVEAAVEAPDDYVDLDFHAEFWEGPGVVYHATPSENVESILESGLCTAARSRGLSNRGAPPAVYTTTDLEEAFSGVYGDAVIQIDCAAMLRDGYTPRVDREPDIEAYEQASYLAHFVGMEDYEYPVEQGMSPTTVVIRGRIPPKYLTLVEE